MPGGGGGAVPLQRSNVCHEGPRIGARLFARRASKEPWNTSCTGPASQCCVCAQPKYLGRTVTTGECPPNQRASSTTSSGTRAQSRCLRQPPAMLALRSSRADIIPRAQERRAGVGARHAVGAATLLPSHALLGRGVRALSVTPGETDRPSRPDGVTVTTGTEPSSQALSVWRCCPARKQILPLNLHRPIPPRQSAIPPPPPRPPRCETT